MSLKNKRKELAGKKPFITIKLYGKEDCLADEGKPLIVELKPPDIVFLAQNDVATSFIIRYSETYKEYQNSELATQSKAAQERIVAKAKAEIEKRLKDPKEQLRQIGVILDLAKEVVLQLTERAYYTEERRGIDQIRFVKSYEEETDLNAALPDEDENTWHVCVDRIDAIELANIARMLREVVEDIMPEPAQIPLETKDGEMSVDADKFRNVSGQDGVDTLASSESGGWESNATDRTLEHGTLNGS